MLILRQATTFWLTLLLLLISACGAEREEEFVTPLPNQTERHQEEAHEHAADEEFTTDMRAVLVPSELVVGPNRFAVGLLDPAGVIIDDAAVHFHYYDLSDRDHPFIESETDARSVTSADGGTTIYAHDRDFERAGLYGLEIEARRADGTVLKQRIGFEVAADTATVGPGEKAPEINTLTLTDVNSNTSLLTSATSPNPALHETSLAQALNNGKPTLLLLATPAYCETRFCGPAYEVVSDLQPKYGDQLNFVYSEVFSGLPDPSILNWQPAPVMMAFGLESEPWLFFIDEAGMVSFRLEGLFTADEVERHLQQRLGL